MFNLGLNYLFLSFTEVFLGKVLKDVPEKLRIKKVEFVKYILFFFVRNKAVVFVSQFNFSCQQISSIDCPKISLALTIHFPSSQLRYHFVLLLSQRLWFNFFPLHFFDLLYFNDLDISRRCIIIKFRSIYFAFIMLAVSFLILFGRNSSKIHKAKVYGSQFDQY